MFVYCQAIQRLKEEEQVAGKEMNVELMILDLASLESTKNFIENFKQKNLPLHMLICNAGIFMVPHGKSSLAEVSGNPRNPLHLKMSIELSDGTHSSTIKDSCNLGMYFKVGVL